MTDSQNNHGVRAQGVGAPCRFPRTLHLPGSSVTDDDKVMSPDECDALCKTCELVCQEKLDGTNVGISFADQDRPVCQKRAGLLGTKEKEQYNAFRNWGYEKSDVLWSLLGTRWVLFGEWLWQVHSIYYEKLPDYFLAFDLLDRESMEFQHSGRVQDLVGDRISMVPELWRGTVDSTSELIQRIEGLCEKSSAFADAKPEGVYVRFERDNALIARAKYRLHDFRPGWDGRFQRNAVYRSHRGP